MAHPENNLTQTDLKYLKECLALARKSVQAGDEPFGSILVSGKHEMIAQARNRVNEVDVLAHPEIELAHWALENLTLEERKKSIMYTSGEHCPMCAAAHGWAQIGSVVYLSSAGQLSAWLKEFGVPESPINFFPIEEVVKLIRVKGPASGELLEQIKNLHRKYHEG